ncbi:MAG: hypothetical protein AMJ62_06875 [Myxococcales bacterium SG8_38]|nr:MAG: hypothetical protein AMJ62_06875 [Myxococcales bacterium SG8_38]
MIRRCCIVAALLALFLQGSSAGHMLLVQHSRCAEHGELIHGGEGQGHDPVGRIAAGSAAIGGLADPGSDEAHEHCALWSDRRQAVAAIPQTQVGLAPACDAQGCTALVQQRIDEDSSRFRVAPKNSPPA